MLDTVCFPHLILYEIYLILPLLNQTTLSYAIKSNHVFI